MYRLVFSSLVVAALAAVVFLVPAWGGSAKSAALVGEVGPGFKIAGKKSPMVSPHKSKTFVVTLTKKGKIAYLCTVPGHAAAGMRGKLTVT